jgi:hypothetical protein
MPHIPAPGKPHHVDAPTLTVGHDRRRDPVDSARSAHRNVGFVPRAQVEMGLQPHHKST